MSADQRKHLDWNHTRLAEDLARMADDWRDIDPADEHGRKLLYEARTKIIEARAYLSTISSPASPRRKP